MSPEAPKAGDPTLPSPSSSVSPQPAPPPPVPSHSPPPPSESGTHRAAAADEKPLPWWRRLLLGRPRDFTDRRVFHSISLVAFLAWVGLGADGLSSSAYGPEEAFKALTHVDENGHVTRHYYLAIALALATAATVLVLSVSYSRIIEHFPSGGGGYVVASKLLGPSAGLVAGCALLVDYVLTITVSVAAAGDALFSLLPGTDVPAELWQTLTWWQRLEYPLGWKLPFEIAMIAFLTVLNLRGVKESVMALMPIFMVFLISHAILIFGGIVFHAGDIAPTARNVSEGFSQGMSQLGLLGMLGLLVRAYSMGGGTYTGIETVSIGLPVMREPRVETAKKTMVYLAVSLAVASGGLLCCYLLFHVEPVAERTLNAVLTGRFVEELGWTGFGGKAFLFIVLVSEGALLLVAAQAGIIAGPRSMANMAVDSYLPHRFSSLSERLTVHNGIVLMGAASLAALLYTGGNTTQLVIMYSINVFLTFSLCQAAMVRFWFQHRKSRPDWVRRSVIFVVAFVLCSTILVMTIFEKFTEGGWVTLVITGTLIGVCGLIKRHYKRVGAGIVKLDTQLARIPDLIPEARLHKQIDATKATAVLLVGGYSGLGIHTLLSLVRFLPNHFHNVVFVSAGVLDSGNFKGAEEVDALRRHTEDVLAKYRALAEKLGFAATSRYSLGIDPVDEVEKLCLALSREFPHIMFFAGRLLFQSEGVFQRLLHNETANAIQRRLQLAGFPVVILPAKVDM